MPKSASSRVKWRWRPFGAGALLAVALLAGCGVQPPPAEEAASAHAAHRLPNGDVQERTESLQTLPVFLKEQDEPIPQIYALAAEHRELLGQMPCYCGCGESAGHRSSLNCFLKQVDPDGSAVWDDHGTRCGVCLEIAVKSMQYGKQGKTVKEIRALIDEEYKSGYGKPTPTPMPQ